MKKPNYVVSFVMVLLVLYLLISLSVKAQAAKPSAVKAVDDMMLKLDRDKDGKISIKESVAAPQLLANFARIDTDTDGLINTKELSLMIHSHTKQDRI